MTAAPGIAESVSPESSEEEERSGVPEYEATFLYILMRSEIIPDIPVPGMAPVIVTNALQDYRTLSCRPVRPPSGARFPINGNHRECATAHGSKHRLFPQVRYQFSFVHSFLSQLDCDAAEFRQA